MDFNVSLNPADLEIKLSPISKSQSSSISKFINRFKKRKNHETVWYSASDPRTGSTYYYDAETGETSWEKPPTSIPIRNREKDRLRDLENELVSVILVHCADLKERYEYDTATEALADWFSIVNKNHDHRISRKEFQFYFSKHHLLHMSNNDNNNITSDHVNALFDAVEGHTRDDPGFLLWGDVKKYLYNHELWALFDPVSHRTEHVKKICDVKKTIDAQYLHDLLCRDVESDEGDGIMSVVFVGRPSSESRVRDAHYVFEKCMLCSCVVANINTNNDTTTQVRIISDLLRRRVR